jgi:hypothetical protein
MNSALLAGKKMFGHNIKWIKILQFVVDTNYPEPNLFTDQERLPQ